jgi:Tol biopolymer transport system component
MKQTGIWLRLILLAVSALPLIAAATPASGQTDEICFAETGQCISGRFREYWEGNGGLSLFGLPVAPARDEFNRDTGQAYPTQWFERNRLELHPENQSPYDVLLGRLGDDVLRKASIGWQSLPKGTQQDGCLWFAETEHAVCDQAPGLGFRSYWQGHGLQFDDQPGYSYAESLALFGQPISEPRVETNSSGDTVLAQWFERARFEWHPDKPDQYKVLLGLLGNEARVPLTRIQRPGLAGQLLVRSDNQYLVQADGSRVMRVRDRYFIGVISHDQLRSAGRCDADGGAGICVANLDGSALKRINGDPSASVAGWSPDDSRIAYVSYEGERRGLHVVNVDGSNDMLLQPVRTGLMPYRASWAPDGRQIAFDSSSPESGIYVVDVDGSNLRRLAGEALNPQWSPTRNRIVFQSTARGNLEIWAVNPDGSELTQLTQTTDGDSSTPRWSPDGTHILFWRFFKAEPGVNGSPSGLYVMQPDGTDQIEVLHNEPGYFVNDVAWSPDGAYIAVIQGCTQLCGPQQIQVVRSNGSERFPLLEADLGSIIRLTAWLR